MTLEAARKILVQIPEVKLSPTKVTAEKFINLLSKAGDVKIVNGVPFQHISFSAFCSELVVFVTPGDRIFAATLTELYDCPDYFSYETISRGKDAIENVYFNLVGGITPVSLANVITDATLGTGFSARILCIFAEGGKPTDPFTKPPVHEQKDFVHDLELIYMLKGQFSLTLEAMTIMRDWMNEGMPPVPADSRFAEYNPRRFTHWYKLSAIRCAARCGDMLISDQDVLAAKADLLEAEKFMPAAFASIGANPINIALEHTRHWMVIQYALRKTGIPESELKQRLMTQIPMQYVDYAVDLLISSGHATHLGGAKPNRFLIPRT